MDAVNDESGQKWEKRERRGLWGLKNEPMRRDNTLGFQSGLLTSVSFAYWQSDLRAFQAQAVPMK